MYYYDGCKFFDDFRIQDFKNLLSNYMRYHLVHINVLQRALILMVFKEIIFVFVFQPIRDYLLPPVVTILHTALKHNWIFIKRTFIQNSVWFKWRWDFFIFQPIRFYDTIRAWTTIYSTGGEHTNDNTNAVVYIKGIQGNLKKCPLWAVALNIQVKIICTIN